MSSHDDIVCSECGQSVGHLITIDVIADCLMIAIDNDRDQGNLPDDDLISAVRQSDDLPDGWEFGETYNWPVFYRCPGCEALGHVGMSLPWRIIPDQIAAE